MADTSGLPLYEITKKFKNGNNDIDRLRELPETVLGDILSLLPTKDADKTSVLSTEWKDMWTLVTNLYFHDMGLEWGRRKNIRKAMFMNFVERVLLLHGNSTIESFSLFCSGNYDEARVNSWISTALKRNAKKLCIHCSLEKSRFLFPRLSANKCPTELELWMDCVLRLPNSSYFSSLKILNLRRVTLQYESPSLSKQLHLNFPVLEALMLDYCEWMNVEILNIHAPALEIFTLSRCYKSEWEPGITHAGVVNIFGPNIRKFKMVGHPFNLEFILCKPSSVVDATIEVATDWDQIQFGLGIVALLSQFSNVKSLALSKGTVMALAHLEDLHNRLPTFDNLINLTISGFGDLVIDDGLVTLLRSSPALESLIFEPGILFLKSEEALQGIVPDCVMTQLKVVVFKQFYGKEAEIKTAKFFLKSAKCLEKMSITLGWKKGRT